MAARTAAGIDRSEEITSLSTYVMRLIQDATLVYTLHGLNRQMKWW